MMKKTRVLNSVFPKGVNLYNQRKKSSTFFVLFFFFIITMYIYNYKNTDWNFYRINKKNENIFKIPYQKPFTITGNKYIVMGYYKKHLILSHTRHFKSVLNGINPQRGVNAIQGNLKGFNTISYKVTNELNYKNREII
jgi:hypothetical protein